MTTDADAPSPFRISSSAPATSAARRWPRPCSRARRRGAGLGDRVDVRVAPAPATGTSANAPTPARSQALAARGYDGSRHRARQFEAADFAGLDLVVAFDRGQERILRAWAPTDDDAAEGAAPAAVRRRAGRRRTDVPDPYYSDAADVRAGSSTWSSAPAAPLPPDRTRTPPGTTMTLPPQPLSPLDGRYRPVVHRLGEHLSEAGLNRARVHVEVEWLIAQTDRALFGTRRSTTSRRPPSAPSSPTSARRRSTSSPSSRPRPGTTSRRSSTSSAPAVASSGSTPSPS